VFTDATVVAVATAVDGDAVSEPVRLNCHAPAFEASVNALAWLPGRLATARRPVLVCGYTQAATVKPRSVCTPGPEPVAWSSMPSRTAALLP